MSERKIGKLLIPSLAMSRTAPQIRDLLSNFLLIEIAQTYNLSIGVTNQIKTLNSAVGIVVALLMGFLSVKYRHKTLLVTGMGIVAISLVGCYLAPTFATLVLLYSIGGFGANVVFPMSTALTGAHIPRTETSKALGWIFACPAAIYTVGFSIANYLGSWRNGFLFFAFPITMITLLMCVFVIPQKEVSSTKSDILAGYKGVFKNKSAVASLIGVMLGFGAWIVYLTLGTSLFRQVYGMSRSAVISVNMLMSLAYIVGAIVSRKIVPKLGTRRSTIISTTLLGLAWMTFGYKYPLVIVTAIGILGCLLAGLRISSAQGLCLRQLPEIRGPMMSMVQVFSSFGSVITLALGGYLLNSYGWFTMFPVIGIFGLIGGAIIHLFVSKESNI